MRGRSQQKVAREGSGGIHCGDKLLQRSRPMVKQNGYALGLMPKIRQSLGILSPAAFGIDLPNWIRAGSFLAAYLILEWVSFIHEYKGLPITPWNPGLGVVFALMIFGGSRYGIVLFAGIILAEILVLKSKLE